MLHRIGNEDAFAVVSSQGGTVHEFVWHGYNIIAPYRAVGNKARCGIPICLPFFGPPPKDMSDLSQHGWLRDQELNVVDIKETDGIVLEGENQSCEAYPWRLAYRVSISVNECYGLQIDLDVTRLTDDVDSHAPINPGFHPYFCSDPSDAITKCLARVGDEVITYFPSTSRTIPVNREIFVRSGKNVVRIILAGGFDYRSQLVIWSDNENEYACLEPVVAHPDLFGTTGGLFLKKGESRWFRCMLTMMR